MAATSPCVLVSHLTATHGDYDTRVANDEIPRHDYIELARRIGGALPLHPLSGSPFYSRLKTFERRLSIDFSLALEMARRAHNHSVLVSMSETVAIPLAAALKLLGSRTPHVMIGHRLSAGVQRRVWRYTKLQHSFAGVVALSQPQIAYATSPAGMGLGEAHFVHDKVDHRFFRPLRLPEEEFILAVGQEQRDYATLARAVAGTGLRLVIVASSPWATVKVTPEESQGVTVLSNIPYPQLRELYARARLVVIPVHDADYAAGVNGVLEGMAMGRPVVTMRTRGLVDYVEHDSTAVLVPPADPQALRESILELWDQPARRAALARRAREAVETKLNLDHYIERMASVVALAQASSAVRVGGGADTR